MICCMHGLLLTNGVADMLATRSDNSRGRGLVAVCDPLVNNFLGRSQIFQCMQVYPQMHMHGLLAHCLAQHYEQFGGWFL
jgi:hypothetical protein